MRNHGVAGHGLSARMSEPKRPWVCITDIESLDHRVVPLPDTVGGRWRIGVPGSGAGIELAEPSLEHLEMFVRGASNHLLLEGVIAEGAAVPALGQCGKCKRGQWQWNVPMRFRSGNELYVRFDYGWLRIGRHAIRVSWDPKDFDEREAEAVRDPARPARSWWRRIFGMGG